MQQNRRVIIGGTEWEGQNRRARTGGQNRWDRIGELEYEYVGQNRRARIFGTE